MLEANHLSHPNLRSSSLRNVGLAMAILTGVGAVIVALLALLAWVLSQEKAAIINGALALIGVTSWSLAIAGLGHSFLAARLKELGGSGGLYERLTERAAFLVMAGVFGSYFYLALHFACQTVETVQYGLPQQLLMFSLCVGNLMVMVPLIGYVFWKLLFGDQI